jgi:hypothetical protein
VSETWRSSTVRLSGVITNVPEESDRLLIFQYYLGRLALSICLVHRTLFSRVEWSVACQASYGHVKTAVLHSYIFYDRTVAAYN